MLTPEQELSTRFDLFNRQEVIALINTLHQLTKSVKFASGVARRLLPEASDTGTGIHAPQGDIEQNIELDKQTEASSPQHNGPTLRTSLA